MEFVTGKLHGLAAKPFGFIPMLSFNITIHSFGGCKIRGSRMAAFNERDLVLECQNLLSPNSLQIFTLFNCITGEFMLQSVHMK